MKIKLITILLLLIPTLSSGSITFDTKAQSAAATTNPRTLAYTCGANAKLLVLHIMGQNTTARTGGAPTYNSVAMTQAGTTATGTNENTAELWYLLAPATGSSLTISVPNSGGLQLTLIASSFNNDVPVAFNKTTQQAGIGANPSLTITPSGNGAAIVDVFAGGDLNVVSANSQTLLFSTDEGAYNTASQYAVQTSQGPVTFSYTMPSDDIAQVVASFVPVRSSGLTDAKLNSASFN